MSLYIRYIPTVLGGGSGGGGGVSSIGTLDGNGASVDGATINGAVLFMQSASDTDAGLVNVDDQTFAGDKTFTGEITVNKRIDITFDPDTAQSLIGIAGTGAALDRTAFSLQASALDGTVGDLMFYTQGTLRVKIADTGNMGLQMDAPACILDIASKSSVRMAFPGFDPAMPTTGRGLEMYYIGSTTTGEITVVDRDTSTLETLSLLASDIVIASPLDMGSNLIHSVTDPVDPQDAATKAYVDAQALTLGNLTAAGTDGISVTGGTGAVVGSGTSLAQHVADATHNGYLSSTDWSTFNGKQGAGNYLTALTGDVAASGPGSAAATIQAGRIVNSMVSATAAIAYSKLALTGDIVNADISASAAIAYSKLSLTGSIVNADINASAAIDFSKLAALTSAHILVGNVSNVAASVAVTGDISLTNAGVTAYSGTVPINKGGTGQTSAANAINALLPSQTGNSGKFLKTDGSVASWATASGSSTAPTVQKFLSTGTTSGYTFIVTSANATLGATYTNNGQTFTVTGTIASGTQLFCTGTGAPAGSGTLTKASGTGDASITFSESDALATYTTPTSPAPLYIRVTLVGAGGSGGSSGSSGGSNGAVGNPSFFGINLLGAYAGKGGESGPNNGGGGAGGTTYINSPALGFGVTGGSGGGGGANVASATGGMGGSSILGGAGGGAGPDDPTLNINAAANSGSGGGGGSGSSLSYKGGGGGAGGAIYGAIIPSPAASYVYSVGAGANGGSAGTSGNVGGNSGSGVLIVEEFYQ